MASVAAKAEFYSAAEKTAFERYFKPPKKRGRGRPKKKQGKNKQKAAARKKKCKGKTIVDLTKRKASELSAKLDGMLAGAQRASPKKRTNWDTPENAKIREQIADYWESQTGTYVEGDSFRRFCQRNNIDRMVLGRYIERRKSGIKAKKRGRPTLLSYDVMKHLCEGLHNFCFVVFVCLLLACMCFLNRCF